MMHAQHEARRGWPERPTYGDVGLSAKRLVFKAAKPVGPTPEHRAKRWPTCLAARRSAQVERREQLFDLGTIRRRRHCSGAEHLAEDGQHFFASRFVDSAEASNQAPLVD